MPRKSRAAQEREKMVAAMMPIVLLPEFEKFMATVEQMKNYTVESMVHSDTVKNKEETSAHMGEIRAYLWFLETYRAQKEQQEAQIKFEQEQQAQGQV